MIGGSTSYSIDTFVTEWTDGKCCMVPRSRSLIILWKCPALGCGRVSREDEMGRAEAPEEYAVEPRFDDYTVYGDKRSLEGDSDAAYSAYLMALWRMNDPMRTVSSSDFFRTSHITFRINRKGLDLIGRLRSLLQMSCAGDRLLAAELARQQSQFAQAAELADVPGDDKRIVKLRDTIRQCCDLQLPIVKQLPWD